MDVSKKNVLNPKKFPAFTKKLKNMFNVSSHDGSAASTKRRSSSIHLTASNFSSSAVPDRCSV